MVGGYGKYETRFRKRKTETLIKNYHKYNDDFRKIARDEFKKRKVPTSKLPYKKRTKRQQDSWSIW